MRTNLAERLGYEPEETTEERRQRIWMLYQQRKSMRRMIRFCSSFICGAAFVLAILAGCVQARDEIIAALTGVFVITFIAGSCL